MTPSLMSNHTARPNAATKSSTVAVATATAFVITTAILSLLAHDKASGDAGWTLRGTFAPSTPALAPHKLASDAGSGKTRPGRAPRSSGGDVRDAKRHAALQARAKPL